MLDQTRPQVRGSFWRDFLKPHHLVLYVFLGFVLVQYVFLAIKFREAYFRSDFGAHFRGAMDIFAGGKTPWLNLWQTLTAGFTFIFPPKLSAGLATAGLELGFVLAVHYWLRKKLPAQISDAARFFALVCVVFSAVPYYVLESSLYTKSTGLNTWHNPTSYAAKPFLVVSFFLFLRLFELSETKPDVRSVLVFGKKMDSFWVTGLLFAVSLYGMTFGKISSLQFFAPAALIFLAIEWVRSRFSWRKLGHLTYIGCMFIPALVLFACSFLVYFPEESDSKLIFTGFQQFLSGNAWHIFLSTAWSLMLPIYITVCRFRTIKAKSSKAFGFAWIAYGIAFLQKYMFAETGRRAMHGNTSWGRHFALLLLFIISVIEWVAWFNESALTSRTEKAPGGWFSLALRRAEWRKMLIGLVILLGYFISGLFFFGNVMLKGTFAV